MNTSHPRSAGFTLIELLVVISIIAILAGIAVPAFTGALVNGRLAQATAHVRQVGIGLHLFAQDHEGTFPSDRDERDQAILSSNDAFRQLVPVYIDSETVFAVPSSPVGKRVDNNFSSPAATLARGENHWAYIAGLSATSNSLWPLVVDHSDGSGRFSEKETEPGGTWKGVRAVLVRTDSSASNVRLLGPRQSRYLPRPDDTNKNALAVREYMGSGARLLEPAR